MFTKFNYNKLIQKRSQSRSLQPYRLTNAIFISTIDIGVDTLINQLPKPLILLGDFNAYNTLWGNLRSDSQRKEIYDVVDDQNRFILNRGFQNTQKKDSWIRKL